MSGAAPTSATGETARGAKLLSIGIASTGLLTFIFFAVSSHVLGSKSTDYNELAALWSILFVAMSVMYRPVEQLLSKQISTARELGTKPPSLIGPLKLQATFAIVLLLVAVVFKASLQAKIGHGSLYWIFVGAAVAYAASYFARGYSAGKGWFGTYGALVLFESTARLMFPLAALIGLASGQTAVALGILAAPIASLIVVPLALINRSKERQPTSTAPATPPSAAVVGGSFAVAVALIQLGEQAIINLAALMASDQTGVIFNAMIVIRAPLQLFQALQTTLLPGLSRLAATNNRHEAALIIRKTVLLVTAFASAVVVGMLLLGPVAMELIFDAPVGTYSRWGLAFVAAGMGAHLVAGTINQAALARGDAWPAALIWILSSIFLFGWIKTGFLGNPLLNAEVGYFVTSLILCTALGLMMRIRQFS